MVVIISYFQGTVIMDLHQHAAGRPRDYVALACFTYFCCNCLFGGIALALASRSNYYIPAEKSMLNWQNTRPSDGMNYKKYVYNTHLLSTHYIM